MFKCRIIPCLDVRDGQVVKGVRFRDHVVMGEIVDLALRYRDEGADELVFYDITASPEGRSVDRTWVERVARVIDIPFCVAGGIRSVDDMEKQLIRDAKVQVFDMRHIDENGMKRTMEEALAGIDDNTHLHVSFDVDFLDPTIAPGVGTTVRGGPNYREAQLCMEMIADTGRLGSLDIVELNPAYDKRNQTAKLAVDLVESLFGKSTLIH